MRTWWVNQNQTFRQEFAGGYIWSPKRNANGALNPFYETMREVSPGDLILSFVDTRITAIGIAESYCFEAPKPTEFGTTGANWENIGWKVSVKFRRLIHQLRPKDHMDVIRGVLPARYSPLQPNGNGLQSVYLAGISDQFAQVLLGLIGPEAEAHLAEASSPQNRALLVPTEDELEGWERKIESKLVADQTIPETERKALLTSRRGQGLFKRRVMLLETRCRITGVDNPTHLIASHCKPWRDASNADRLNGENGLLLTPSIDHLFDRGFISFDKGGDLIVSPVAHTSSLERMGVEIKRKTNVGSFSSGQQEFLDYHRNFVLLKAQSRFV